MKLRIVQVITAATIIVFAMLVQAAPGLNAGHGNRRSGALESPFQLSSAALAQDNDEDDNWDDDNEDDDNWDDDNWDDDNWDDDDDDNDEDDNDEDNEDDDSWDDDNEDDDNWDDDNWDDDNEDADNGGDFRTGNFRGPFFTFDETVTEARGISTGGDSRIGLPGDRVLIQVFPWMPQGVSITLRLLDPFLSPQVPGARVGSLIFQVEASDMTGFTLPELPAEVNLSARYNDHEVAGLNESNVTLLWLDPVDFQWKEAPKLVTDPWSNYVAASVVAVGTYAVVIP